MTLQRCRFLIQLVSVCIVTSLVLLSISWKSPDSLFFYRTSSQETTYPDPEQDLLSPAQLQSPPSNDDMSPPSHDDHTQQPLSPFSYPDAYPPLPAADVEEYVALCLAVKDQVEDLPELFIHHYYHVGIRRFYIMDDGSSPPLSDAKAPGGWGIPDEAITFHYFNRSERTGPMQHAMYRHCHEWHGHQHKWFGFFDADEFIEMTAHSDPTVREAGNDETLVDFLQSFDGDRNVGAIALNWLMHTPAGILNTPTTGGVRKNFRKCLDNNPDNESIDDNNTVVKCFVKSDFFTGGGMHTFDLANGTYHVGELGPTDTKSVSLPWSRRPVTHERIALHHYGFLSREQYERKKARGNAFDVGRTWEQWESVQNGSQVDCSQLAVMYP